MRVGDYELTDRKIVQNLFYVYFYTNTGKIEKIINFEDTDIVEGRSYFVTNYSDVEEFLTGTGLSEAVVSFDPLEKSYKVYKQAQIIESVNNEIYQLTENKGATITVIADYKTRCWKIQIAEEFKEILKNNNVYINTVMHFSVTEKNNPNILYRLLTVPFNEAYNNDYSINFDTDFELHKDGFSVYSVKKFDTYSIEIIYE